MRTIIWDDKEWNRFAELQAALHAELILERENSRAPDEQAERRKEFKCAAAILFNKLTVNMITVIFSFDWSPHLWQL